MAATHPEDHVCLFIGMSGASARWESMGIGAIGLRSSSVQLSPEVSDGLLVLQHPPDELSPDFEDIGGLKASIAAVLQQSALGHVVTTDLEVARNRANMRLSVLHLPITGRTFYEQVMAAGDDRDATQALVDEIVRSIST